MAKIINIDGGLYYLQKASTIVKSNRKIYTNQTASEKAERENKKFYDSLPPCKHSKKRVYHLHKKGLIK
jgi:hypothetical protein